MTVNRLASIGARCVVNAVVCITVYCTVKSNLVSTLIQCTNFKSFCSLSHSTRVLHKLTVALLSLVFNIIIVSLFETTSNKF